MRRVGLVDQLEVELEQMISKGWLPQDGRLPSERTLAQLKGISRSTAREALVRLKSRGLIVRHPGRLSRALPLDESLTLENLRVALHGNDAEHPKRHVLLGGYFALKRQLTLEVLVACCERASDEALKRLDSACFMLENVARHREERVAWAWQEFEVLRQAALAARMPGHLLLLQSLERAFHGMASWVLPLLDSPREEAGQRGDAPQADADSAGVDLPGALGPNGSDFKASSSQPPPAGAAPPEPSRAAHRGPPTKRLTPASA